MHHDIADVSQTQPNSEFLLEAGICYMRACVLCIDEYLARSSETQIWLTAIDVREGKTVYPSALYIMPATESVRHRIVVNWQTTNNIHLQYVIMCSEQNCNDSARTTIECF